MPHRPSNSEVAEPIPQQRCFDCLWTEAAEPCPRCLEPSYATFAEAVEAIRRRQGWPKAEISYAYSPAQQARQMEQEQCEEESKLKPDAVLSGTADTDIPLSESIYLRESEVRAHRERLRVQRDQAFPEPIAQVIVDRITGDRYTSPRFTDNGVIAIAAGEEFFLPAGAFDVELA